MSMGKQLTPHPHISTPHGHKAANPQHNPLGPAGPLAFLNTLPSPAAEAALSVGGLDLSARWPMDLSPAAGDPGLC